MSCWGWRGFQQGSSERCVTTALKGSGRGLQKLATNSPHVTSVPAHVGLPAPEDAGVAVCVLPGTELAFSIPVTVRNFLRLIVGYRVETLGHATAIFRQVNKDEPFKNHDALEFPDGRIVLLTRLSEGQEATVLQLPAQPSDCGRSRCPEAHRLRRLTGSEQIMCVGCLAKRPTFLDSIFASRKALR